LILTGTPYILDVVATENMNSSSDQDAMIKDSVKVVMGGTEKCQERVYTGYTGYPSRDIAAAE